MPREPTRLNIEELREALQAVTEFLENMQRLRLGLVDEVVKRLDGKEVGRDTAEFYNTLVEAGLPRDTAAELTHEYLKHRLELVPKPATLVGTPFSPTPMVPFNAARAAAILALLSKTGNTVAMEAEEDYEEKES
ncbi:hypothetical protein [Pyrodictium abyssi]|uniref:Uncharacterized protein n=1 Tax=Pyrodictium abyssi TaxID=54256 RepID=A0ABN6ZNB0_9CREN|nr:hypothetical protein PABY_04460 [Pyrodictium abyssi]